MDSEPTHRQRTRESRAGRAGTARDKARRAGWRQSYSEAPEEGADVMRLFSWWRAISRLEGAPILRRPLPLDGTPGSES